MTKRPSLAERMKAVAAEPAHVTIPTPAQDERPAANPGRARSRAGKKLLLIPLDETMHKALKHRVIDDGVTIEAFVRAAIAEKLAR